MKLLGAAAAVALVSLCGVAARAQVSPVVAGAIAGAAASQPVSVDRPLQGRPLPGWLDPRTGSPGRLNVGCGMASEVLLSASGRRVFVDVVISNESEEIVTLLVDRTRARFSTGLARELVASIRGDEVLRPGWNAHVSFTFPSKAELEGQDWLEIELAFANDDGTRCSYATRVERDTRQPPQPASWIAHSTIELQFSGGPRFAATGDLGALVSPVGGAIDFGFAWYPAFRHGPFVDLVLDYYGSEGASRVAPTLTLSKPRVSGAGFFLGWGVRAFPFSRLSLAYQPAVGAYALELLDGGQEGSLVSSGAFAFRERVRLQFDALSLRDGTVFSVAANVVHLWLPSASLGEAPASGNAFSALLSIVVGG